jgi:uncharacterized protein YggU (UPF0235/DUF167 family)
VRIEILVRPGALRDRVGGTHDGALVVRVTEQAEKGKATRAALRALAESLGISPHCVDLIRGSTSRRKLVEITTAEELVQNRLRKLYQDEA